MKVCTWLNPKLWHFNPWVVYITVLGAPSPLLCVAVNIEISGISNGERSGRCTLVQSASGSHYPINARIFKFAAVTCARLPPRFPYLQHFSLLSFLLFAYISGYWKHEEPRAPVFFVVLGGADLNQTNTKHGLHGFLCVSKCLWEVELSPDHWFPVKHTSQQRSWEEKALLGRRATFNRPVAPLIKGTLL